MNLLIKRIRTKAPADLEIRGNRPKEQSVLFLLRLIPVFDIQLCKIACYLDKCMQPRNSRRASTTDDSNGVVNSHATHDRRTARGACSACLLDIPLISDLNCAHHRRRPPPLKLPARGQANRLENVGARPFATTVELSNRYSSPSSSPTDGSRNVAPPVSEAQLQPRSVPIRFQVTSWLRRLLGR
jgi:hypothetical protein